MTTSDKSIDGLLSLKNFRKFTLTIIACLFLLSGCDEDKLKFILDSHLNSNYKELFQHFGHPKRVENIGSERIYYYGYSTNVYVPQTTYTTGNAYSYGYGNSINTNFNARTQSYGGYYANYSCDISFLANSAGKITSWNSSGNYCNQFIATRYINQKYLQGLYSRTTNIDGFELKPTEKGLKVKKIMKSSIAYQNGLRKRDLIQTVNNKNVLEISEELMRKEFAKKKFKVGVLRDNEKLVFELQQTPIPEIALLPKSLRFFLGCGAPKGL